MGPILALGRDRFGNQNMKLSRHQHPPIVPIHHQCHDAEIIIIWLDVRQYYLKFITKNFILRLSRIFVGFV